MESNKRKLSKGLLEMKFMKRTKDKHELEKEVEESTAMFSDQITTAMKSGANKTIIERSLARCKGLPDGRLSYQGMNIEIERLMEIRLTGKEPVSVTDRLDVDVTDSDMATYNMNLNEEMAKKFMTKSERQVKRPRFMKPDD